MGLRGSFLASPDTSLQRRHVESKTGLRAVETFSWGIPLGKVYYTGQIPDDDHSSVVAALAASTIDDGDF